MNVLINEVQVKRRICGERISREIDLADQRAAVWLDAESYHRWGKIIIALRSEMHGGESSLRPRDVDDVISERKRKKEVQILTLDNVRNARWTGTFLASSQM